MLQKYKIKRHITNFFEYFWDNKAICIILRMVILLKR